jgi:glucose-1-phosphate adenylyltransferase
MPAVLCLILGGGRGARLYPLTKLRSKPAVPVAGKYRLIDIPISNCINSGMNRIYVLTQFLSVSLHRHIANTYKFDMFGQGFVEVLAAQQTMEGSNWYQGTADAVRQNLRQVKEDDSTDVLILSGDQLYRMNFRQLMDTHRSSNADATIAVIPKGEEEVSGFGILKVDERGRMIDFYEKPKTRQEREPYRTPKEWIEARGLKYKNRPFLASMGIYLFKKDALLEMLESRPVADDFGSQIFPRHFKTHRIFVHPFDGYWEDLGTIRSYHEASLALASSNPPFDFSSPDGVIYTRMRYLPATRVEDAVLSDCLLSDGCVVMAGTRIEKSLLGVRSYIGRNVAVRETVIIGADRYETDDERESNRRRGIPNFNVGDGTIIERAILDKDCRIGRNVRITNERRVSEAEGENYVIRDGIVCIPRGAIVADNTII